MSASGEQSEQFSQSTANRQSSSFIDQGQNHYLNNLWAQGTAQANPAQAQQFANMGAASTIPALEGAMGSLMGIGNPDAQIAAQDASLQAGLGDLFRNELMPAMQTDAIAAGGLGGGRQGVAEAGAVGQIADAYTQGRGDIVAGANQTALGALGLMPGVGQAIMGIRDQQANAGLNPLMQLAQILGGPAILSQSTSNQQSTGGAESQGFGFGFGSGFF